MPTTEWNRKIWGEKHTWDHNGDEWEWMAAHCRQPYAAWKGSLVDTLLAPGATGCDVLEIGPGRGRWTEHLLEHARTVWIVDINQNCLDHCRERFGDRRGLRTHHTSDCGMEPVPDASLGFVWSFDVFVHLDEDVITGYLDEIARILEPGGSAVIHHAGKPDWTLRLAPLTRRAGRPGKVVQRWVSQRRWRDDGNRSDVSPRAFADWARAAGLRVTRQRDSWGDRGQYDVTKYRDCITLLEKPA
ncbi:class I SAM-dependent methyltransferase [Nocardiopsis sp. EMB25]|uniref:class I SAM-dependent methyltransferase n=1 Tax=Nocardiopsis sp. EMB25 TaxID=2835867 RepID=UPI002284FDB6|nr:class I SAM-dependent methyltransferase [Nocardiopsis sp. EMB25]MCY9782464.1 class I SAM-dependent methyltransferase [Nocardiopsis sp. EMB25]